MSSNGSGSAPSGALQERWAAIVAADVVGYSTHMARDPETTVAELEVVRGIVAQHTENHGGYVADKAGDSAIAVFDTAIGAVLAACEVQKDLAERAAGRPEAARMFLRLGVHLGDILKKDDGTVYGDGVNIAARLEGLAPTGGVTVSDQVRTACAAETGLKFLDQGEYVVKNIDNPVRVHLIDQKGGRQRMGVEQVMLRRITKGNIPSRSTELIGRADMLEDIRTALEASRLVTLFGMGGLGKTSLSVESARLFGPNYPDGAWFADLGAVADPAAVGLAIAGVFGVAQQSGKTIEECLVEALRGRRLLLVLDNCEHVTQAAATLADALLANCPKVSIIATSREALSISGEQIMPIPPLEVEGQGAPALDLFAERALAVSPGFDRARYDAAIRDICERLDGIPLAIELAAARVRSMTPEQINTRLDQRFRLLTGGSRAAYRERHQTLRNAVQWSYDLLTETEMTVLDRASVFVGGFTLEAAEKVCSGGDVDEFDVVDTLDSLVSKSLIIAQERAGGLRYRMLETIRAFGEDRLEASQDAADVHRAHARLYADQADAFFQLWRSPRQIEAHKWLDLEINNLRNAFRWAKDNGEVDPAARIASSVGDMARFRLREEAANWAEEIVDQAREAEHPRLAILLTWCASSAWAFSRFEDAQKFGEEALALLDDPRFDPFVWAYGDLAFVAIFSGDVDKAIALLAQGAAHPADAHDRMMMTFHLYIMATAGHAEAAREIADDVVAKVDAAGVPMAMSVAHAARGAAIEAIDPEGALAEYERGIEIASTSGARFMETLIAPRLAALHLQGGDSHEALQGFERMLLSYGDATDMASVSAWRASLVVLFAQTGQYQAAATLHGTLVGLIDQSSLVPAHAEAIEQARESLGVKAFSDLTEMGAGMSLREAADYAIAQVQLGLKAQSNKATG